MEGEKILLNGPIGDQGMSYEETVAQEDYATYASYLSLTEEGNCSVEEAMELLGLSHEQIDGFIEAFEPKEKDLEDDPSVAS